MKYITLIILILLAVAQSAAADTESIRKQNQYKGRDIRVNHHRSGYTQAPNHFRKLLPINSGNQLGDYSHAAKPSVHTFPAIRYIERRQR